jgi:hypothetical protein
VLPIGLKYDAHYTAYQPLVLRLAPIPGATSAGTWRPLAMGGCDGCDPGQNYQRNLMNGYENPVRVGDTISVEASDRAALTYSGLAARLYSGLQSDPRATPTNYAQSDPRIIEVPSVDFSPDDAHNGISTASVHGFAKLWITSVDAKGNITVELLESGSAVDLAPKDMKRGALTPVLLQ